MNDALSMCRTATGQKHHDLDSKLGALDFSRPADYRAFLEVMLAGFEPCERWLRMNWAIAPETAQFVDRTELLRADLAALTGSAGEPLRFMANLPLHADAQGLLGVLYVLEGSRRGARLLSERVSPGLSAKFLTNRDETIRWPLLRAALTELSSEEGNHAVENASGVFDHFILAADAVLTPSLLRMRA